MERGKVQKDPLSAGLFEDFSKAETINMDNLQKILSDNQGTVYGRNYNFSQIRSEEEYRRRVPLTEYPVYAQMSQKPEEYTAYPVNDILATSGTTGVQKKFCITAEALQRYSSYIYEMPYVLMGGRGGPHIHMSVFRSAAAGINLLSAVYYKYLLESGKLCCDSFVGGRELMFSDHIQSVPYVKAWLALSCPELVSIQSIFLYDILLLFGYLEENWQKLLSDMRNRTVRAKMEPFLKERLLGHCPGAERIQELEHIFSQGFEQPIARRLWKQLRFISGIGGQMYRFQGEALKNYTGEVPIYYFTYTSSECMAGVALEMDRAQYAVLPRSAYYEFLSENGEAVSYHSLQAGEVYEPVITTFSGLYRYRMGDRIKIVSFAEHVPVFEVVGRRSHILNIAGEKLDEETIRAAVGRWAQQLSLQLSDFAMGIDARNLPCRYCLFAETKEMPDDRWAAAFDRILRALSADYDDVRSLGMLARPCVRAVEKGVLRQISLHDNGQPAHHKPRIFMEPSTALLN